jgi:hypothetical protein
MAYRLLPVVEPRQPREPVDGVAVSSPSIPIDLSIPRRHSESCIGKRLKSTVPKSGSLEVAHAYHDPFMFSIHVSARLSPYDRCARSVQTYNHKYCKPPGHSQLLLKGGAVQSVTFFETQPWAQLHRKRSREIIPQGQFGEPRTPVM